MSEPKLPNRPRSGMSMTSGCVAKPPHNHGPELQKDRQVGPNAIEAHLASASLVSSSNSDGCAGGNARPCALEGPHLGIQLLAQLSLFLLQAKSRVDQRYLRVDCQQDELWLPAVGSVRCGNDVLASKVSLGGVATTAWQDQE